MKAKLVRTKGKQKFVEVTKSGGFFSAVQKFEVLVNGAGTEEEALEIALEAASDVFPELGKTKPFLKKGYFVLVKNGIFNA